MAKAGAGGPDRWNLVSMTAFLAGVLLQAWLWSRAWLHHDQVVLLRLGTDRTLHGESMLFLHLLFEVPVALWFDYVAPGPTTAPGAGRGADPVRAER